MDRVGRAVGYALLGLVDAAVPVALLGITVILVGPATRWTLSVAARLALLCLGVGAVLGTVAAVRGGRPFPLARGAVRLWDRYWWLPP